MRIRTMAVAFEYALRIIQNALRHKDTLQCNVNINIVYALRIAFTHYFHMETHPKAFHVQQAINIKQAIRSSSSSLSGPAFCFLIGRRYRYCIEQLLKVCIIQIFSVILLGRPYCYPEPYSVKIPQIQLLFQWCMNEPLDNMSIAAIIMKSVQPHTSIHCCSYIYTVAYINQSSKVKTYIPIHQPCQIWHPNWARLALNGSKLGLFRQAEMY